MADLPRGASFLCSARRATRLAGAQVIAHLRLSAHLRAPDSPRQGHVACQLQHAVRRRRLQLRARLQPAAAPGRPRRPPLRRRDQLAVLAAAAATPAAPAAAAAAAPLPAGTLPATAAPGLQARPAAASAAPAVRPQAGAGRLRQEKWGCETTPVAAAVRARQGWCWGRDRRRQGQPHHPCGHRLRRLRRGADLRPAAATRQRRHPHPRTDPAQKRQRARRAPLLLPCPQQWLLCSDTGEYYYTPFQLLITVNFSGK